MGIYFSVNGGGKKAELSMKSMLYSALEITTGEDTLAKGNVTLCPYIDDNDQMSCFIAKLREEKKEEQEEIQEKRDERQEELEELIDHMPVKEMTDLNQTLEEVKQQVQKVLNNVNLIEEDIKGAKVDLNA